MRHFILTLGHGRLLEANYILWKLIMGTSIFLPQVPLRVAPLDPLRWYMPDQAIAMPFLCIGIVQLTGLIMNIRGYEESWKLRMAGGAAALGMWSWLFWQSLIAGVVSGSIFATSICGFIASLLFCYLAYHRLPIPGAPGNI